MQSLVLMSMAAEDDGDYTKNRWRWLRVSVGHSLGWWPGVSGGRRRETRHRAPGSLSQWPLMSVVIRPGSNVLCRLGTELQTDNTIISSWRLGSDLIMGHKSSKMEHGLSQADLNFLVKNTNRSKKEIKVGLKLKLHCSLLSSNNFIKFKSKEN